MNTKIVFALCFFPAMLFAQVPFGSLDCPNPTTDSDPNKVNCHTGYPPSTNGPLQGSIGVTGWALSINTVIRVAIYRDPIPGESGLVWIQDAPMIEGARPDVAGQYPGYPKNDWGFGTEILTNKLPDSSGENGLGNGTYRLHAIAYDKNGQSTDFGQVNIYVDNADSHSPFGTIDTPEEGGTASGASYVNFGWALTPQPNYIPFDGSTMQVVIDGQVVGQPTYNQYRSDIANLFPGLMNSNGAVGYFYVNTNFWGNGLHTISWNVWDNAQNGAGIGSRFFTITGVQGVPSFTVASPVSTLGSNPNQSSACSDITGTWHENTNPQATWSISQSPTGTGDCGAQVCGDVAVIGPGCGNVIWQVNGSLTNASNGTFTLYSMNPNPSSCSGNPVPSATDTVTLSFPSCTTGSGVHTDSTGSFNTSWTDPAPQIPSKLTLTLGPLRTHSGGPIIDDCDVRGLPVPHGKGWGWSRCGFYTVLDQTTPGTPLKNTTKYTVLEKVTLVSATFRDDLEAQKNPFVIGPNADFHDFLGLNNPDGPMPAGSKGVFKQVRWVFT